MKMLLLITFMVGLIALCKAAIEDAESLSKLTSTGVVKQTPITKDLEASASDRSFLIGREYGYGNGGYGAGSGNYPWIGGNSIYNPTGTGYYDRGGNGLSTEYRGYQTGIGYGGIIGGGNTGWGYYGNGASSYPYGYRGIGYGSYNGYSAYPSDTYGYRGTGYGSYNAYSGYPSDLYGYRGSKYGGYSGYPSGYRGYS